MNYIITTKRLGLRNWRDSDLQPFSEMNRDPEVMRYFPSLFSKEQTIEGMERQKDLIRKAGHGFFAVDLLETGKFVGFIGLNKPGFESDFTPCIEIGWRLDKQYWNLGLATEGAMACLRYGFDTLGFDKIYSFTAIQNKPSERVMQKIGMKKVDTFDHPLVDASSGLKKHVLYLITADT